MGLSPIWLTKRGGMELRQLRTNTKRKFPSSRLPLRTRSRCRQHTNALGRPIGEKNMQRAGGKQLLSIACDSQLRKGSVSEKEGRRKGGGITWFSVRTEVSRPLEGQIAMVHRCVRYPSEAV